MPSRYGPGVLPRAFDFGGIIDRALQGYLYGSGLRRERRQERERQEDRKVSQLSQPGAATLDEYLGDVGRPGGPLLTERAAGQVGRASEPDVDWEFQRPEPTTVTLPGGQTSQFQERAPIVTGQGVVIDPRRAREERTLAAYLDAEALREPIKKPWEREGFATEDDYLDYLKGKTRATTRPSSLGAARRGLRRTPTEAHARLYTIFGQPAVDANGQPLLDNRGNAILTLPPEATPQWIGAALAALEEGREPPPLPEPVPMRAPPIRVTGPRPPRPR